jgi:hypothetical protein
MVRPLAAAWLAAALPAAAVVAPSGIAPAIAASALEEPAFALSANGVHVFECRVRGGTPNGYGWTFVAPDATLYDGNASVARLATPNLWESLDDRSSVGGVARASQSAGPANLPWLLMRATPLSETGRFAGITSIQRVNTSGGVAPSGGCGADNVGAEARVAFSADYYFYRRR